MLLIFLPKADACFLCMSGSERIHGRGCLLDSGVSVWQSALGCSLARQALPLSLDGAPVLLLVSPGNQHPISFVARLIGSRNQACSRGLALELALLLLLWRQCVHHSVGYGVGCGGRLLFALTLRLLGARIVTGGLALFPCALASSLDRLIETWAIEVVSGDVGRRLCEDAFVATGDDRHLRVERILAAIALRLAAGHVDGAVLSLVKRWGVVGEEMVLLVKTGVVGEERVLLVRRGCRGDSE